jgi:hypothetical protein
MFLRVVNALLGLWLFASAFMFSRAPAQFINVLLVSLLVMALGVASILGRDGARKVNFALGVWLVISSLALPHASGGGVVNQIVTAALVMITSLFPEHVRYQRRRPAT